MSITLLLAGLGVGAVGVMYLMRRAPGVPVPTGSTGVGAAAPAQSAAPAISIAPTAPVAPIVSPVRPVSPVVATPSVEPPLVLAGGGDVLVTQPVAPASETWLNLPAKAPVYTSGTVATPAVPVPAPAPTPLPVNDTVRWLPQVGVPVAPVLVTPVTITPGANEAYLGGSRTWDETQPYGPVVTDALIPVYTAWTGTKPVLIPEPTYSEADTDLILGRLEARFERAGIEA